MVKLNGGEGLAGYLEEMSRKLRKADTVQVGFLEGAAYPDGTSIPLVAAVQEFGSPANNIPPRPFFRNTIRQYETEWPKATADLLVSNGYDSENTLEKLGAAVTGQIQESINEFDSVPLKPATIARKGFDKQLIDTGTMLRAVDYRVVKR